MPLRYEFKDVKPMVDSPAVANVIIEIPKGRRNKFEIDKETGLMKLDRYLYSSSHYPGDYGFVPQTLAEDGDPLDMLVMVNEPTFSGCLIKTRVIGLFRMTDHGVHDYKLLGVPDTDPLFAEYQDLKDCPKHVLREIEHFFTTYKQLEGITVQAEGWGTRRDAILELEAAIKRYRTPHRAGGATRAAEDEDESEELAGLEGPGGPDSVEGTSAGEETGKQQDDQTMPYHGPVQGSGGTEAHG